MLISDWLKYPANRNDSFWPSIVARPKCLCESVWVCGKFATIDKSDEIRTRRVPTSTLRWSRNLKSPATVPPRFFEIQALFFPAAWPV
jgi:hypothetical protein